MHKDKFFFLFPLGARPSFSWKVEVLTRAHTPMFLFFASPPQKWHKPLIIKKINRNSASTLPPQVPQASREEEWKHCGGEAGGKRSPTSLKTKELKNIVEAMEAKNMGIVQRNMSTRARMGQATRSQKDDRGKHTKVAARYFCVGRRKSYVGRRREVFDKPNEACRTCSSMTVARKPL